MPAYRDISKFKSIDAPTSDYRLSRKLTHGSARQRKLWANETNVGELWSFLRYADKQLKVHDWVAPLIQDDSVAVSTLIESPFGNDILKVCIFS